MKISLIAALTWPGRVLGKDGALPWRLSADLQRFKALTMGHAVLMGRKTWESLPAKARPLPGRLNLVLSRQSDHRATGATDVRSLEQAVDKARLWYDMRESQGEAVPADAQLFVIGGAQVYALALPKADRLCLTLIHHPFDGDAHFPDLDLKAWTMGPVDFRRESGPPAFDYEFVDLRRGDDVPQPPPGR